MSDYTIDYMRNIKHKDIKDTSNLLFDSFVNDPYSWSVAVGFSLEKLEKWIDSYVVDRVLCRNPPSIVVKIEDKIVGVFTIEDFNNQPDQPDNKEIDDMANACGEIIKKSIGGIGYYTGDIEKMAYISFIAVDKEYRRKNIAESMIDYSTKILIDLGYKYSISFCTSYRSKRLFEKKGYECIGGISYKEFTRDDGSKPFLKMPDDQCSVMMLYL